MGGASPLIIGSITGVLCYLALGIKDVRNWYDSLDVVAVHLVGGIVGTPLLAFFADATVNAGGFDGGGLELLEDQLVGALFIGVFSFVVTYAIAVGINRTIGLRVDAEDERIGLDQTQHAESAYTS